MNSQGFLVLSALVAGFFILWYSKGWGGASKGPTRLDLRAPDSEPVVIPPENASTLRDVTPGAAPVRLPSVMFNYNGHSWDAYEVLGVKADAGLKEVTAAYQAALQKTQPESHAFLEIAYRSILHRF